MMESYSAPCPPSADSIALMMVADMSPTGSIGALVSGDSITWSSTLSWERDISSSASAILDLPDAMERACRTPTL